MILKFVYLFGPQAVGKMTVGQELSKITDLKLFHNHMTIDLLEPLFGFGSGLWRLSNLFREEIVTSFAKSNEYGMVFTFVWAFNQQEDWKNVERMCTTFLAQGAQLYFMELEAPVEERLKRNKTPNRLEQKPTKRNIKQSVENLVGTMESLRLNSEEGEIKQENHLRIDHTNLHAEEVAKMIKREFAL
ncbi:DEAD/DEAH box helicase family protein [Planococcus lenghuensis]|uniref:Shikimate kinase n=1 Tax=Planococcus lenghuensis TaxID=2213202 RepID=A0A1Q2L4Z8_9BACL|nr:AAA family ATPase [Planococcus lenghuensis]AQQ55493.1 shikimate kinase [Planococcus lenghuensis]